VQGWTIGVTARLLNMLSAPQPGLVDRLEVELPGGGEIELVGYRVHPESAAARGERIPRWARPVVILRDGATLTIHNAGPLRADDQVYLFASPRQIRSLDQLYASPAGEEDPAISGDFIIDADTTIEALARQYGLAALEADPSVTVGRHMEAQFSGEPRIGDRLTLDAVDLIVNALDDDGRIARVAVAIDPTDVRTGRLPVVIAGRIRDVMRRLARLAAGRAHAE
jgi:cell volume regulation protein A